MSGDLDGFLAAQRRRLELDKLRLNLTNKSTPSSTQLVSNYDSFATVIGHNKAVQTDIKDINSELLVRHVVRNLTTQTSTDRFVDAVQSRFMDKPKSILSNRRTGASAGSSSSSGYYQSSTSATGTSYLDGFSYTDRTEDLERERIKREVYQRELRAQIEEKRHLAAMRDEQERHERDIETRRLERQLQRMRDEQDQHSRRRSELMRRHSDDLLRRKTELHELQRPSSSSWQRQRLYANSESANLDSLSNYSPPMGRKFTTYYSQLNNDIDLDPATWRGRFTSYDTVPLPPRTRPKFDRFDSLSRIDSLTHRFDTMSMRDGCEIDSFRRSPRLRRRNSTNRFNFDDDPLQLPPPQPLMLKARSPVAKELRNAVPFSSAQSTYRYGLESPLSSSNMAAAAAAVSPRSGGILTQLGPIRAQLRREQMRMDDMLRHQHLRNSRNEY